VQKKVSERKIECLKGDREMADVTPYTQLNQLGLIGLYRIGLFDSSGGYEGTFFQQAWESKEMAPLFLMSKKSA